MIRQNLIDELNNKHLLLAHQIRAENNIHGSSDKAYAFIITLLTLLFPGISYDTLKYSIVDNFNDGNIDAILFQDRKRIISIFDIKLNDNFGYNAIKLLRDNIDLYLLNPQQDLTGLDDQIVKRIKRARKYIAKGWKLNIIIARGKTAKPNKKIENIMRSMKAHFSTIKDYYYLDTNSIVELSLGIKSEQQNYEWKVRVEVGENDPAYSYDAILIKDKKLGPINAMFARIRLIEILRLQKVFIENNMDLFDANVRDFQKNKKLSKNILSSINKNPNAFYMYHNGITFSCHGIEILNNMDYKIKNPQIINGCQTVRTIYDRYKNNINNKILRKASVLCKFYALEGKNIERVCEATNSQLKINLWDLRTNDKIQKLVEAALKAKGINYIRKYSGKIEGRVSITDLAQWIYSCKYGKPAEAKNRKSKLFDIILEKPPYYKIFNENINLDDIVNICEIAIYVNKKVSKDGKRRLPYGKDADLHIIAGIYKLARRKWSLAKKYRYINNIVREVVKKMKKRYGKDITYNKLFTKSEDTWELMARKLR